MSLLSIVGLGTFLIATTVIGVRLLLLAIRTRKFPELMISLAFLLSGALGYVPVAAAPALDKLTASQANFVLAAGLIALNLGSAALWCFTWRIFKPNVAWATALSALAAALLAGSFLAQALTEGFTQGEFTASSWYWIGFTVRAGGFGWGALESFRYYAQMRRRVRLDLACTTDTQVFLFWGIATTAAFTMFAMTVLGRLLSGAAALAPPIVAMQSIAGLISAGAIWMTFFPPIWYARRLQASASSDG